MIPIPKYSVSGQHVWRTEGSDLYFVARRHTGTAHAMQIAIVSKTCAAGTTFKRLVHVTKVLDHGQRIREQLGCILWSREFQRPTHEEEQTLWLQIIKDPLPWFMEGLL